MATETGRLQQINEILLAALSRATRQRPAFLEEVCGEDQALRREVESLLDEDSRMAGDLSRPAFQSGNGTAGERSAGDRIGPYHVLRKLGQGGMGAVYLAARADGEFDRQVAVKVLKPGMATGDLVRRFRVERQILANLDHAGIARLHEGGTTKEGHPYLVMEYVKGEPLDRYCDIRRLPIRERLGLFRKVCSAVQFAHRNLVVHLDLKPSNILVTAAGEPKLLDFGIAKLIDTDRSPTVTDAGARPMTPRYASPEQVRGEAVTTASDVYLLGILLYELLTGHHPHRLGPGGLQEVERAVCHEEPQRPSNKVLGSGDGRPGAGGPEGAVEDLSRLRGDEPRRLGRRLRGDLDNIVLTALRKEPQRRYNSVEQLSNDLERYLEGHPVQARKDTFPYRGGKFLRRHRGKAMAAALAGLVLAAVALDRERQRDEVIRERDRAERVTGFLVELFEISDPNEARANSLTVREVLDRGAEEIRDGLEGDPDLRAALMATMGRVYLNLGLYDPAAPLLQEALTTRQGRYGTGHPSVLESMMDLANLHRHQEAFAEAESLVRQALEIQLELWGRNHRQVAQSIHNLGTLEVQQGKYEAAEASLREALTLRRQILEPDHPDLIESLNNILVLLMLKGDLGAAEPLAYEVLELRRRHYEEDHPLVLMDLFNLANLHLGKGEHEAMRALCQEGLELCRRRYGERHPKVAEALDNLAVAVHALGELEQAESLLQEALDMKRELLGEHHPGSARTMAWLAELSSDLGDVPAATSLLREALALLRETLGEEHPETARTSSSLAALLHEQGEPRPAEALYQAALPVQRRLLGDDHPHLANTWSGLAWLRITEGDYPQAEPLVREALRIYRAQYREDHWRTVAAESILGACLSGMGRLEEAEDLLTASYRKLVDLKGTRFFVTRKAQERLQAFYDVRGEPENATFVQARPSSRD